MRIPYTTLHAIDGEKKAFKAVTVDSVTTKLFIRSWKPLNSRRNRVYKNGVVMNRYFWSKK